jgi:hypothetical protein
MHHLNEYMKGLLPIVVVTIALYLYDSNRNPHTHSSLLEIFGGVCVVVFAMGAIKEYNRNDEV